MSQPFDDTRGYEPIWTIHIPWKKKTENMVRLWMGQRNPASWLLVYLSAGKHPILYRVFYYSRWFRISQPSTVSCHCPSFFTSLYSLRIGGILIPQKNWGVNDSNPQHPNENPNDLNRYSPGKITPSVAQELLLHHPADRCPAALTSRPFSTKVLVTSHRFCYEEWAVYW